MQTCGCIDWLNREKHYKNQPRIRNTRKQTAKIQCSLMQQTITVNTGKIKEIRQGKEKEKKAGIGKTRQGKDRKEAEQNRTEQNRTEQKKKENEKQDGSYPVAHRKGCKCKGRSRRWQSIPSHTILHTMKDIAPLPSPLLRSISIIVLSFILKLALKPLCTEAHVIGPM